MLATQSAPRINAPGAPLKTPWPLTPRSIPREPLAFCLDFDGTLVDIAERPDAITVDDTDRALLDRLVEGTEGAVAIVSGRNATDIKAYLTPFRGIIVGGHGSEMIRDGEHQALVDVNDPALFDLKQEAQELASATTAFTLEEKRFGVVFHFRDHPDMADRVLALAKSLLRHVEGFELMSAKCAVEIRPCQISKARAVLTLASTAPFKDRTIIFAGDDVTDEEAHPVVRCLGGYTIKIGPERTTADFRVSDPASFKQWLRSICDRGPEVA